MRPQLVRCSLGIAFLLVWYSTAFRVTSSPSVAIPFEPLAHPRQDIGWLSCLLATTATCTVLCCRHAIRKALHHGQHPCGRPQANQPGAILHTFASSFVTCVGTAISICGSTQPIVASLGGGLSGIGFALVVRQLAVIHTPLSVSNMAKAIVCALGMASLIEAAALLLAPIALHVFVCATPFLAAGCFVPESKMPETEPQAHHGVSNTPLPKSAQSSHIVTALFCFLGLGLFMGIIGFNSDALSTDARSANNLATSALGGAIGCLAFLAAWQLNHDGPFILTPVLLGTAALMLPFAQTGLSSVASVLGKTVNDCAFLLAVICIVELSDRKCASQTADPASLQAKISALVGGVAGIHMTGILLGGVLVTLTSLDITALSLVGASLVYLAMLALGFTAQRKGAESYIIVRNPQDVARIAAAQASAIASAFPELSERETDVLELLLQHQTIDRIAETLGISRNTVKSHISHIYAKTGLNSRQQLVDFAATRTIELGR